MDTSCCSTWGVEVLRIHSSVPLASVTLNYPFVSSYSRDLKRNYQLPLGYEKLFYLINWMKNAMTKLLTM
jgi:hypothetical protein